ncbi:MAG: type II toxin-antitoxin system death-on-curing family toxin [Saprospiraceae bacterium]|nr:type II toxin-antitoxin system death-on-curing family toxin [Saprospiraceae bacterium]
MIFDWDEVNAIHQFLISEFGGSPGVRDQGQLEAALNRPQQTFDGSDLYPTAQEKAAAILESIVINHPFIDGNKRVGYVLMRMTLLNAGLDIDATQEEKYQLVISVAKGELNLSAIIKWINEKIK